MNLHSFWARPLNTKRVLTKPPGQEATEVIRSVQAAKPSSEVVVLKVPKVDFLLGVRVSLDRLDRLLQKRRYWKFCCCFVGSVGETMQSDIAEVAKSSRRVDEIAKNDSSGYHLTREKTLNPLAKKADENQDCVERARSAFLKSGVKAIAVTVRTFSLLTVMSPIPCGSPKKRSRRNPNHLKSAEASETPIRRAPKQPECQSTSY